MNGSNTKYRSLFYFYFLDGGNYKEDLTWFLFTVKVKNTPQFFLVGPNLRVVASREILARAWKSSPAGNVTRGGQFSRIHACFPRSITPSRSGSVNNYLFFSTFLEALMLFGCSSISFIVSLWKLHLFWSNLLNEISI